MKKRGCSVFEILLIEGTHPSGWVPLIRVIREARTARVDTTDQSDPSQSAQSGKSVENRAERTVFKQLLKPCKLILICSHIARIILIDCKLTGRHLYSPIRQGVAAAKRVVKSAGGIMAIHFYAL